MNIEKAWPPNIDEIDAALKCRARIGVIFAYGDTIYNPHGVKIGPYLLAHEGVHLQRQRDPVDWWKRYIADPQFRFDEELPAHIAEARAFAADHRDRNQRTQYIGQVARRLSGPLYGNMVSFEQARQILRAA